MRPKVRKPACGRRKLAVIMHRISFDGSNFDLAAMSVTGSVKKDGDPFLNLGMCDLRHTYRLLT